MNLNQETVSFEIEMLKTGPMQFTTTFDKDFPDLLFDEPKHGGGEDKYPNATRILTASISNCLLASLSFCIAKTRIEIPDFTLKSKVSCTTARNEQGRWRIKEINVQIFPGSENHKDSLRQALDRCKNKFSDYCVVSESVRKGFDINFEIV